MEHSYSDLGMIYKYVSKTENIVVNFSILYYYKSVFNNK